MEINSIDSFYSAIRKAKGKGYSERSGQIHLSKTVESFLDDSGQKVLALEAATGIGKTYGVLVPALLWAKKNNKKVLVLTKTIALGEQLFNKDIPFLCSLFETDLKIVMLKGRSNYADKKQAELFAASAGTRLDQDENQMRNVVGNWLTHTKTGELSELPYSLESLQPIASNWDNGSGHCCEQNAPCFYHKAQARAAESDLVVSNYHVFFTYLAKGLPFPQRYDLIICDEAHSVADTYSQISKKVLCYKEVEDLTVELERLFKKEVPELGRFKEIWKTVRNELCNVFSQIREIDSKQYCSIEKKYECSNEAIEMETALTDLLRQGEKVGLFDGDDLESKRIRRNLQLLSELLRACFIDIVDAGHVWSLSDQAVGSQQINCADVLSEKLMSYLDDQGQVREPKIIALSATLTVDGSFDYWKQRTGIRTDSMLIIESPFKLEEQMELYTVDMKVKPNSEDFVSLFLDYVPRLIRQNDGHTLVLVSNIKLAKKLTDLLDETLDLDDGADWLVLSEHHSNETDNLNAKEILQQFSDRKGERAVIIGLDRFKEGIDLPGEQLTQILIDRIPFKHVNDPFVVGNGKEGFFTYQIPQAKIKLRQAIGRLIRQESDKGKVYIFDKRMDKWNFNNIIPGVKPKNISLKYLSDLIKLP